MGARVNPCRNVVGRLDCEQSVFVRENPTSDKKSRKYANEGKERGENKARHEKNAVDVIRQCNGCNG